MNLEKIPLIFLRENHQDDSILIPPHRSEIKIKEKNKEEEEEERKEMKPLIIVIKNHFLIQLEYFQYIKSLVVLRGLQED